MPARPRKGVTFAFYQLSIVSHTQSGESRDAYETLSNAGESRVPKQKSPHVLHRVAPTIFQYG